MRRWVLVALFLAFTTAFAKTEVAPFRGRVTHVADGDSIVVRVSGGRTVKVRIAAIDAPEQGQAYSTQARQSLRSLTLGAELQLVPRDVDRYGRVVARVLVGGKDIGLEQIRRGLAWHYAQFASQQEREERSAYARAERVARSARAGLWKDATPVAPWRYRRR